MLAATLISIHNIYTLLELVRQARQAIIEKRYSAFAEEFLQNYVSNSKTQTT
jgi:queuine tRNA-ribosyltransferase